MFQVIVDPVKLWDEINEVFLFSKEYKLTLEHSLISLSKWEAKWHKPFLTKTQKSDEESLDYIRCMTINKDIDSQSYNFISKKIMDDINLYIEDPMTATTFQKEEKKPSREIITSELIYFWMVNYSIPFECEKWHLNRLLTLINVCSIKNQPKKKLGRKALNSRNTALNEARLRQYNTTG